MVSCQLQWIGFLRSLKRLTSESAIAIDLDCLNWWRGDFPRATGLWQAVFLRIPLMSDLDMAAVCDCTYYYGDQIFASPGIWVCACTIYAFVQSNQFKVHVAMQLCLHVYTAHLRLYRSVWSIGMPACTCNGMKLQGETRAILSATTVAWHRYIQYWPYS